MAKDRWGDERSSQFVCSTCTYYLNFRCRRHAPTMQGFPPVYPSDKGCGDHRLSKETMRVTHIVEKGPVPLESKQSNVDEVEDPDADADDVVEEEKGDDDEEEEANEGDDDEEEDIADFRENITLTYFGRPVILSERSLLALKQSSSLFDSKDRRRKK